MNWDTRWSHSSPMIQSVAALYALGMTPKPIAGRLQTSSTNIKSALQWMINEWQATDWRTAARMEAESICGEEWSR